MFLLKTDFRRDITVLLVVTILIISLLAGIIGYLADFYFGDTVNGLIGDYGDYDWALIINEDAKEEALPQIKEIIDSRIPGSKLIEGVDILGKSNFFIKVDEEYRSSEVFSEMGGYFDSISGFNNLSLMIEPRVTLRGLRSGARDIVEEKVDSLEGVDFSFGDRDRIEVIVEGSGDLSKVEEKLEIILDTYQVLSLRLPITEDEDGVIELSNDLMAVLEREGFDEVENITSMGEEDMDSLIKTMQEMNSFLSSYSTEIEVEFYPDFEIKEGERLVLPSKGEKQIIVRIEEVDGNLGRGRIEQGDSLEVLGDKIYRLNGGSLDKAIGDVKVNNPRQELARVINDINRVLPYLEDIFKDADGIIDQLAYLTSTFDELEEALLDLKGINQRMSLYKDDLNDIDLDSLIKSVNRLDLILVRFIDILERMNFLKGIIEESTFKLEETAAGIREQAQSIANNPYQNSLYELEGALVQLAQSLDENTSQVVAYINQYNPLLQELLSWKKEVDLFKDLLSKGEEFSGEDLEGYLSTLDNQELIEGFDIIKGDELYDDMMDLRGKVIQMHEVDFEAIIGELEYIQESLPKLRDEDITQSIDLINRHISGEVIPGGEISLLMHKNDIDIDKLEGLVERFLNGEGTLNRSEVGVIAPNLRGQVYQIVGEVKTLLTAVAAIILTIFSLFFDQSLIINSIKLKVGDKKLSYYYGVGVGATILGTSFYLTGAQIPYFPVYGSFLLGGLIGLIVTNKAETLNKVSKEEFIAGESFGFSYSQIMREIVIPAGKPGLLKLINKRYIYFD
ncbi:hypothetical protein [Halonatronum saccharophilum]|uniref:hypothetical protein n=1 Tax=Halonatronum saccharophilum TaxID=150060 RepID=UPI00048025AA|nr:hypothetical protein [Halonatronum saccharophilum]